MKLWGWIALGFVNSAFVIACASSSGGGTGQPCGGDAGACPQGQYCQNGVCVQPNVGGGGAGGGQGGFGGGVGGGSGDPCTTACNKAASANCPGQSKCLTQCQAGYSQIPPNCKTQFDAYLNCATASGTFVCDSSGNPKLNLPTGACSSESSALTSCMQSGTGGTGTGGFGGGYGGMGGYGGGYGGMGGYGGGYGGMGGYGGGYGGMGGYGGGYGGGGAGGTGGTPACGIAFSGSDATCDNCANSYCCSELSACGPGTQCNQLLGCMSQYCASATTQAELQTCINTNCPSLASALTQIQAVYSCACTTSTCQSACQPSGACP